MQRSLTSPTAIISEYCGNKLESFGLKNCRIKKCANTGTHTLWEQDLGDESKAKQSLFSAV